MSKLSKYKELFAEEGGFDIPENMNIGFSIRATPTLKVSAEYGYINYGNVPSVGNASNSAGNLGADNGKGFGWSNVSVTKLGAEWNYSGNLTLRGGININSQPIQGRDITFNIIAPGVVTSHYTLGGTYALSKTSELTFAYMYAPSVSVSGASTLGAGGNETLTMTQQSLGIQYGWKY